MLMRTLTGPLAVLMVSSIFLSAARGEENTDILPAKISDSDLLVQLTSEATYNKYLIPHYDTDNPISVEVDVLINGFSEFSAVNMEFGISMYFRQKWRDERLDFERFNNSDSEHKAFAAAVDLDVHPKFLERIWQPDPAFLDYKQGSLQTLLTPSKMLRIHRNGTVLYSAMINLLLTCRMNLRHYPMDVQTCELRFESFGYRDSNLKFKWKTAAEGGAFEIPADMNTAQFSLIRGKTCARECLRSTSTGNFSCLQLSFLFQRNYGYHLLQTFLPSVLIVILSWVSFYISPDAIPARVMVGVTSVLTMTTQSSGLRKDLPAVSYIKAIDVWMTTCMTCVFAALLEFAFVNVLREAEKTKQRRRMAAQNKTCEAEQFVDDAVPFKVTNDKREDPQMHHQNPEISGDGTAPTVVHHSNWTKPLRAVAWMCHMSSPRRVDNIAKVLFPLLFGIFNVVYWMIYLNLPSDLSNCEHTQ